MAASREIPPLRLVQVHQDGETAFVQPHQSHATAPDDELALLARGGDRAAFEALVRRHQRAVLSFATRFFGQAAIAADVAQETFLDVLRGLARYRPEGKFAIWLYRIALNRCRM